MPFVAAYKLPRPAWPAHRRRQNVAYAIERAAPSPMSAKEPSFTFGIEEEYHLVDLAIAGVRGGAGRADEGVRGRRSASRSRPSSSARRSRSAPASTRTSRRRARSWPGCAAPSPRPPASTPSHPSPPRPTRSPTARPSRRRPRRATRRWPSRLRRHRAAARHLRHARARRHRRRRAAHRSDEPGALFPAAPAHAVDVVALLAGRGHRASRATASPYSTSCRAPGCRSASRATASTSARSTYWCATR